MNRQNPVVIAGAGLAGSLLAAQLSQRGWPVALYERRGDMRLEQIEAGRSINLALAERGWEGLRRAGAVDAVRDFALPMRGRMLHDRAGATQFQTYGLNAEEVIWSVHRGRLNQCLLDAAAAAGANLHFHQALQDVDFDARRASFVDERNGSTSVVDFAVLIGADGAGSALRAAIAAHGELDQRTDFLDHAYKELRIAPSSDGGFALDPEALHIWPRGGYMLIALPNPDASFTATLFMPREGDPSFASLNDDAAVCGFFADQFADAGSLIPDLCTQFRRNPTGQLGTLRCGRWHQDDRALLIGDAAHAIVPFHGQGMNCAFEDCVALLDLMQAAGGAAGQSQIDWAALFQSFEQERRPNAHAIAEMALENYLEMRDAVADPGYQLRRQLELELARRLPGRFVPRYSLVMFTSVGYAQARERGRQQLELLRDCTEGLHSFEQIDLDAATARAAALCPPA